MLGTRAHGKTKTYRYYSCYRRTRYDTTACTGRRIDARRHRAAVTGALADLFRHQHDLIADAITAAWAAHAADQDARRGELAVTEHELARTGAAIDRYLTAFENGTLDPEDLAGRLAHSRTDPGSKPGGVPCSQVNLPPLPRCRPPAALRQVADHISEGILAGSHNQRKALIEALVAQVKITGPGRIVPVFRIPQPAADTAAEATRTMARTATQTHKAEPGVRALTNVVGRPGLEPGTHGLKVRCSTIELTPRDLAGQ
jgi:site-specific DNA recombinase